jgi:hypothetical protein
VGRVTYFVAVIIFTGCASFSTYQSPEVLEPQEKALGIGFSEIFNADNSKITSGPMEIYGRFGIVKNLDVGVKLAGFIPWLTVFTDVKYQFLREPIMVSADLGYSFFHLEDITTHGLYPMVLLGRKYLYGGIKAIYLSSWGTIEPFDESAISGHLFFPGVVVGTSFGDRTRLLLEANIYFTEDRNTPLIFMGVALQHNFLLE